MTLPQARLVAVHVLQALLRKYEKNVNRPVHEVTGRVRVIRLHMQAPYLCLEPKNVKMEAGDGGQQVIAKLANRDIALKDRLPG